MSNMRIACPYCGEEISANAKKCRYCGEWLQQPSQSYQSVQQPQEVLEPQSENKQVCSQVTPATNVDTPPADIQSAKRVDAETDSISASTAKSSPSTFVYILAITLSSVITLVPLFFKKHGIDWYYDNEFLMNSSSCLLEAVGLCGLLWLIKSALSKNGQKNPPAALLTTAIVLTALTELSMCVGLDIIGGILVIPWLIVMLIIAIMFIVSKPTRKTGIWLVVAFATQAFVEYLVLDHHHFSNKTSAVILIYLMTRYAYSASSYISSDNQQAK